MTDAVEKKIGPASYQALQEWKRLRGILEEEGNHASAMSAEDASALEEWKRIRDHGVFDYFPIGKKKIPSLGAYPIGKFNNLDSLRLRWIEPGVFDYLPKAEVPFSFTRYNEETIVPRRMFTDGGTVPRLVRWIGQLDPWGYTPAYLLHDWIFEVHHCNVATGTPNEGHTFEDSSNILMEAINTMRVTGLAVASPFTFGMIDFATSTFVAKRFWNRDVEVCPLPPDMEVE